MKLKEGQEVIPTNSDAKQKEKVHILLGDMFVSDSGKIRLVNDYKPVGGDLDD